MAVLSEAKETDLGVHDSFLFEASEEHVHGEHLAPQVTVVLGVVATGQVAKGRGHVGSCRDGQRGQTVLTRGNGLCDPTWRRGDSQDLPAEACVLLGRVHPRLGVQGLVHLGQDDLPQVEQTCGGRRSLVTTVTGSQAPPTCSSYRC